MHTTEINAAETVGYGDRTAAYPPPPPRPNGRTPSSSPSGQAPYGRAAGSLLSKMLWVGGIAFAAALIALFIAPIGRGAHVRSMHNAHTPISTTPTLRPTQPTPIPTPQQPTAGPTGTPAECTDESYFTCQMPDNSWTDSEGSGYVVMLSGDSLEGVIAAGDQSTAAPQAAFEYLSAAESGRSVSNFQLDSSAPGAFTATVNGTQIAGTFISSGGVITVVFAPSNSFASWSPVLEQALSSIQRTQH